MCDYVVKRREVRHGRATRFKELNTFKTLGEAKVYVRNCEHDDANKPKLLQSTLFDEDPYQGWIEYRIEKRRLPEV